jgi:hypothetical protein
VRIGIVRFLIVNSRQGRQIVTEDGAGFALKAVRPGNKSELMALFRHQTSREKILMTMMEVGTLIIFD